MKSLGGVSRREAVVPFSAEGIEPDYRPKSENWVLMLSIHAEPLPKNCMPNSISRASAAIGATIRYEVQLRRRYRMVAHVIAETRVAVQSMNPDQQPDDAVRFSFGLNVSLIAEHLATVLRSVHNLIEKRAARRGCRTIFD